MGRVTRHNWPDAQTNDTQRKPRLLTSREREVLQLLAEGRANKEVATTLSISTKTAETHRSRIMAKLEMHSMSELVRYAIRNHTSSKRSASPPAAIPALCDAVAYLGAVAGVMAMIRHRALVCGSSMILEADPAAMRLPGARTRTPVSL